MDLEDRHVRIDCDKPSGVYAGAVDPVISAPEQAGAKPVVYYTDDGSDPSDPANPNRQFFDDKKRFSIGGNGAHAILCYTKDDAGKEAFQAFGWEIDDDDYPETRLSPSAGGNFVGRVRIDLTVAEPCAWTRYTLDGSEPSETHGETYTAPIVLDRTARLRFRSRSLAGKLEPVRSAVFNVTPQLERLVFDSEARRSGYLVARQDDHTAMVGTGNMLRIGAVAGNGDSRAILHFDTASLPDNAQVSRAFLEVAFHSTVGDPWADGGTIAVDVQRGYFGYTRALHASDWDATATADGVAQVDRFSDGSGNSTDFSRAGLDAINKTGVTQCRLRMTPGANGAAGACLMLEGGTRARLHVILASPV